VVEIVLVEPQIAVNTGSIIRLCANAGARLHLVEPLGFSLDDRALRRGGLDYHELADTRVWESWSACRDGIGRTRRWYATTARADAVRYDTVAYAADDLLVFGREADGLPDAVIREFAADALVHIPMRSGNRSINLANAVAIVAYEAWRQDGFDGATAGSFEETRRPLG
jgi:tRNA (cytidine/uridine-2'-O-)-methyltransferase